MHDNEPTTIHLIRVYDKGHPDDCDCGECYRVLYLCQGCTWPPESVYPGVECPGEACDGCGRPGPERAYLQQQGEE